MLEPAILLKGPFRIADFAIETTGADWQTHPEYEQAVMAEWESRSRRAAEAGDHLWDGVSYRIANSDAWSTRRLKLGTVPYRYVATYRRLQDLHRVHGLEPTSHLSICALIRTTDDFYLFGRRRVRRNVDLIGGGVQPDELRVANGADLELCLFKELREETGIPASAVTELTGLGVVLSGTSNILIVGHATLSLSREQAQAAFAHREEDEMGEFEIVSAAEIKPYLRSLPDYRPLVADLF
jgi:8-oxo-dGTP pyrophosphatase MutT (NUDIX family)